MKRQQKFVIFYKVLRHPTAVGGLMLEVKSNIFWRSQNGRQPAILYFLN